jgi:hypothetical protein
VERKAADIGFHGGDHGDSLCEAHINGWFWYLLSSVAPYLVVTLPASPVAGPQGCARSL